MFYNMRNSYVLTRDVFYVAYHMHMHFSCIHMFIPLFFWYWSVLVLFCLFLSLSFFWLVALWHLNENPLRPRTLFVLGLLLLLPLTLFHLTSSSVMIKLVRTFQRTSHDEAFIQNAKSFYWIFPILTFPLSSTVRVGSHCVTSQSLVPPWSYRSFTPICTDLILQYLIFHSHSRYAYRSHSGYCIQGTTCS